MTLKKGVIVEDTMNSGQQTTAETATAGTEQGTNNNAGNASQSVTTDQNTESAANKRIREILEEKKALETKLSEYEKNSNSANTTANQSQSSEGDRLRIIELTLKTPAHLKDQIEGMATFSQKHPTLSPDQVVKFFETEYAQAHAGETATQADNAATQSRTGGNASSAAKTEHTIYSSTDDEKTKQAKLKAELESRIKSGERI